MASPSKNILERISCNAHILFLGVERHRARLIRLEYVGEGPIDATLMLVGKVSSGMLVWVIVKMLSLAVRHNLIRFSSKLDPLN